MATARAGGTDGADHHTDFDWQAVERSPEFRELVTRKKAFVIPATIFFMVWYFGFIILAGYAPDFMGREFIADGLTVGYVLAFTQFIMTWLLGWLYVRKADREFDPLAARAREAAVGYADGAATTTDASTTEAAGSRRLRDGEIVTEDRETRR